MSLSRLKDLFSKRSSLSDGGSQRSFRIVFCLPYQSSFFFPALILVVSRQIFESNERVKRQNFFFLVLIRLKFTPCWKLVHVAFSLGGLTLISLKHVDTWYWEYLM
jgi:hypothetical protein